MKELSIKETEFISAGGLGTGIKNNLPGYIGGKIADKAFGAWANSDQYKKNMETIKKSPYHRYMNGTGERSWGNGGGGGTRGGGTRGGGGSRPNKFVFLMCTDDE